MPKMRGRVVATSDGTSGARKAQPIFNFLVRPEFTPEAEEAWRLQVYGELSPRCLGITLGVMLKQKELTATVRDGQIVCPVDTTVLEHAADRFQENLQRLKSRSLH